MVVITPFGKFKGQSIEQMLIKDIKYFYWFLNTVKYGEPKDRAEFLYDVCNNYVSTKLCHECDKPAEHLSVYYSHGLNTTYISGGNDFIYCSQNCFSQDPRVSHKGIIEPLKLDTALKTTKSDSNQLAQIIFYTMGMKTGTKTKEYLHKFFNNVKTK